MIIKRSMLGAVSVLAMAIFLAGCSSSRFDSGSSRQLGAPQNLAPVQSSSVQSSSLPPLQGQDGMVTTNNTFDPNSGDPALSGQDSASIDGSFVSLDDVGGATTPGGRDLSGSLTPAKLLGVWTVSASLQTCRLNLTQTTKSGTNRYRASAPNCEVPVLALVSSWQLTGSQVQLYDESGAIIGAFQLSGNRFIGTLSGGVAVTMEG
ncbi:AprI/Inh family metalloprotease inhibitor [Mariluticola halotolerans]|uniref:AprI/Inh family metalloprotease inhibitor n=1 Tax=Mariluticola halotolerans TaxID=2909283 RepID=UPI0026E42EDA|nr:AprI/Inh family metalloprotease inhibitor [Mariluticola halotolerans]UJQ93668.1 protease inhibitor Inh/omp19 family protein [Mariluticola halotolerans]